MTEKNFIKEAYINRTRTLADGTKKVYRSKVHYRVGDPNRVKNAGTDKMTSAQKEEVWTKYSAGVTIKRICADIGLSYGTVKKCIDKKKRQNVPMDVPMDVPADVPMDVPAVVPTLPNNQQVILTNEDIAELYKMLIDM